MGLIITLTSLREFTLRILCHRFIKSWREDMMWLPGIRGGSLDASTRWKRTPD